MIFTHTTEEPQSDLYDACPSCGYSPCECDQYHQAMDDDRPDAARAMGWPVLPADPAEAEWVPF